MGHKRKPPAHQTFAEIVESVTAANPEPDASGFETYNSPIHEAEYIDQHGVTWQMRGRKLRWPRIQHLILDHQVPVVHVNMDQVREIPDDERRNLLVRVRPCLKNGECHPHIAVFRSAGDQTDFIAAEFTDDRHRSLLVIEEDC